MDACPSGKTGWLHLPVGARFCSTGNNASNYCYGGPVGANGDSGLLTLWGGGSGPNAAPSTDNACIAMVPNCAVAAPGGVTAAGKTAKITVSWDSSGGGTSFTLKRGTISGSYGTTVASGITGYAYNDTTAVNGTRYYYVVIAKNSYGTSGNSSAASAYAIAKPTLNSATGGNGQITLAWSAATGATAYNIKRSTSSGGPYATVQTNAPSTGSYLDTGLTNGTRYYYVISGTNTVGPSESDNSVERSAIPVPPIPKAPTVFVASAGDGKITLTWNSGVDATTYTLFRGTASGSVGTTVTSGITGLSYADTGLTNGTTYYYVIRSVNVTGSSGNSAEVFATPAAVPAAPENFAATPGNAKANLSWDASSGATGYSVKRRTTPTGSATTVAVGNVTSYSYTGLVNGTLYYFSVVATNSSGTSPESNQVSVTPVAPPSAPTGFVVTGLGNNEVSLSWGAVSGATSYTVSRSTTSGSGYSPVSAGTDIAGISFADTGLMNTTQYYYVVTAKGGGGSSSNSAQVTGKTIDTPTLTPAAGTGRVTLSWNASPGATGYKLKRIAAGVTTTITLLNVTSYIDTGRTNNTVYNYVVAASNATGTGTDSPQKSARPIAAPTNFVGVAGDTAVTLSWTKTPGADSYDLRRSTTPTGASTTASLADVSSYTDFSLTNGTAYYYHLVAKNDLGTGRSDVSAQITVTPNAIPATPVNFKAVPGNAQITLSWDAVPNATSYKLIRSLTPSGVTTTISLGNVTSRVDSSLTNGTAYYYVVVAVNSAGTSPPSAQVSATPQVPSSIVLTLAPTPSRCSQKTIPSSTGVIEVRGSLAVSGGFPPYTVAWTPSPAWKSPTGSPLPFLAKFRYSSPVETFATTAPFPAITATITDAAGGTASVSRNIVPCPDANACVMP